MLSAGGDITHELGIIHSVGARLSATEVQTLRGSADVARIYDDQSVDVAWWNSWRQTDPYSGEDSGTSSDTDTNPSTDADSNDPIADSQGAWTSPPI